MKIKLLAVMMFLTSVLTAQKITGYVTDESSFDGISDVQINDITNNKVYFSGNNGYYEIESYGKSTVVVEFSHLNYIKYKHVYKIGQKDILIELKPKENILTSVVISASRNVLHERKIPQNFEIISASDNKLGLIMTADDYLKNSSSLNIQRPLGIYTSTPIITTSGMGGVPGRTLVLFNGVALNKSDDGNVNWNMLPPSAISKVEVTKNSFSTLYGNNAMGGVINFLPYKPDQRGFSGFAKAFVGQFNTYGTELGASYLHYYDYGFFFNLDAFAQKSDGYISTPDSLQYDNIEYIPSFLSEFKVNVNSGYDFNRNQRIELMFNFFDDKRGLGERINESEGAYTKHSSQFVMLKYSGKSNKSDYGVSLFAQNENYFKNIENLKSSQYTLIYVNSLRQDLSANVYLNYSLMKNLKFSSGINLGLGFVDAADEYQTSTDIIINKGIKRSAELYLQSMYSPFKNDKLVLALGSNINYSMIDNPRFIIENSTSATSFMIPYSGVFENNSFQNISYNTGVRWNPRENFGMFVSFNNGFNAPTLDDMTRSGLMRLGFKLANPNLQPEKLTNTSAGLKFNSGKIIYSLDANYNLGRDYMYYVKTGETIFGGSKNVIQKQNITGVTMYDLNSRLDLNFKKIGFFAHYTYNRSIITEFDSIPELVGKNLIYSPTHTSHVGGFVQLGEYKFSVVWNYFSKQYTDNENSKYIKPYYTLDAKISGQIIKNVFVDFSVQNIFNYKYLIYDDQISLGQFYMFSIKYKW